METNNKNKEILRKVYNAFETGNTSQLDAIIDSNAVDHNPDPNNREKGLAMVKKSVQQYRQGFPDLKMNINSIITEGDRVIAQITMTGTHKGEFMGIPATNKKVNIEGYDHVRIQNGKLTERWGVFDMLSLLTQCEVLPPINKIIEKARLKEAVL